MRPAGFEPTTYCLEGSCSIRMSYDLMMYLVMIHPVGIAKVYTIEYKKSQSTALPHVKSNRKRSGSSRKNLTGK